MYKKTLLKTALASSLLLSSSLSLASDEYNVFHVTITNTTANHVLTPPAVIAHNHAYRAFRLGMPSSAALATLAETGNPGPFVESAAANANVMATVAGDGPIMPGASMTIEIVAPKKTRFSVLSMLATTNDAFAAATNIKAPKKKRHAHAKAMTFDAGSELNNESCDYIPGPPCNNGINGNMEGEGFVTVHNGVYGKADLIAADLDWRGTNMMISIHNAGER
ncbi:MAG: spondin domain-containing protein [Thiohalomonadales bacterium]